MKKRMITRKRSRRNERPVQQRGIPNFIPDAVISSTYRYQVATASSDVVSLTLEMPIAPYAIASTSTALIIPFKAVRLSRVRIWCDYRPGVDMSGNTVSLTAVERRGVRPIEWTAIASYGNTAIIDERFRESDWIGKYYATSVGESNPELTFRLTKGSVLELTLSYVLSDGSNAGSAAGSGLSFPRVYSNRLSTSLDVVGKGDFTVIVM